MKVKTSITISKDIIREIDKLSLEYGNRSALIEKALKDFLSAELKRKMDLQDMKIINKHSDKLNKEAEDVLSYQVAI